jgi:REP element-mobilizing transposase RayT
MSAEFPLAYLITFRCYGTWLHGDERGSTDRFHNHYGEPFIAPSERWRTYNSGKLRHLPITLTAAQRKCVEIAICETCQIRGWSLLAKNARTNHVHSLVAAGITPPDRVLNALKANATRQLRQHGEWLMGSSPWSERGSKPYVWTELGIERAKEYVTSGQDVKTFPELDQYRRQ